MNSILEMGYEGATPISQLGDDLVVINLTVANYHINKVLVDTGSFINAIL